MDSIAAIKSISSDVIRQAIDSNEKLNNVQTGSFDSIYSSMIQNINETSDLQNNLETEEIKFALGLADNTNDLTVAQQKASTALNYTVAVRDRLLDAYKEIMNITI
ncbi:flagellar hook-basal body complex protein FliE [Acetitomaculum ruminis DSM 5522]|uniref:Flagellar hook-basal body complex protein FliE n=1 Tax=Acetitomaculum ruminis DSM 5522 TaxID=1120918 RepID=A0A1I0ZHH2_9FIRM|nr:flagellar hook-basal body complex protein FliE [Acetitomaculum ruminis]SFB24971.1 flagellar hook-basal body complex protein FliE [Acetitomaculum ruminis DSM 5522]